MSLLSCRECKNQVSSDAVSCPQCGVPSPGKVDRDEKGKILQGEIGPFLGIVLLILGIYIVSKIFS